MKKLLLVAMCLMVIAPLAVFASGQKEQAAAASTGAQVSAPGVFPIVKDKVTLTYMIPGTDKDAIDSSWANKHYEEKTNVHINWQVVPQANADEKRKVILASGDFPEAFFGMYITQSELMQFGGQGQFLALDDLMKTQGFFLKKLFAKYPHYERANAAPDGKTYALPYYGECYHCTYSQKMWINYVWLKNLGLKMPATTDDFYNVLKAFRDRDPNGNGKKDEIPLSGAIKSWNAQPYDFLMNAFIYNDGDRHIQVKSGKVELVANKTEWRDGLRWIRKLYQEGLIDPNAFTQDQQQLITLVEGPELLLGASGGGYTGNFSNVYESPLKRSVNYECVPPLMGPAGVRNSAYYPSNGVAAPGMFVITNKCANPTVAFKWADMRYDDEESISIQQGIRGVHWDWAKPGEKNALGQQALWTKIKQATTAENVNPIQWGGWQYASHIREGQTVDPSIDIHEPKNLESLLFLESNRKYAPYTPKEFYPPIWMKPEAASEIARLQTPISDYIAESTVGFITGSKSIDGDWDAYVKEFDKMELTRWLSLLQSEMDRVKK